MTLLHALRVEMNMTYLFVAHDLQAVAHLCNKIVFLYKGRIVEAVSYTHLDVYKRQRHGKGCKVCGQDS